jgi:hypothetical protein
VIFLLVGKETYQYVIAVVLNNYIFNTFVSFLLIIEKNNINIKCTSIFHYTLLTTELIFDIGWQTPKCIPAPFLNRLMVFVLTICCASIPEKE